MSICDSQLNYRRMPAFIAGVSLALIVGSSIPLESVFSVRHLVQPAYANGTFDHESFDFSSDAIDDRNNRFPNYYPSPDYGIFENQEEYYSRQQTSTLDQSTNIWPQIRAGFGLDKFDSKLVKRHEKRFTRNPEYFERILERAATYLPYMFEQANQYGLPSEVVLLPLIESGYNPRIYSSKGAAGLWQFMPTTGRLYGLKQDWWYEGRRDITRSTEAALRHLIDLNRMFNGDWPLAFSAYNAGSNGIKKAIQRNQRKNKPTDFASLKLNAETRNYYPKLIAVKNIIQNPDAYGVKLPEISPASPFEIVEFNFQVDLHLLAAAIEVETLKLTLLNPGLRRHSTPPQGPYRILVPEDKLRDTLAWKKNLQPADAIGSITYVVKKGDTLSEIAEQFSMSTAALKSINSRRSNLIRIGEVIRIPIPRSAGGNYDAATGLVRTDIIHLVIAGDSLSGIAQAYKVKLSDLRAFNGIHRSSDLIKIGQKLRIPDGAFIGGTAASTASASGSESRIVHVVNSGDSLWSIARTYQVRVADLLSWNRINRNEFIRPGQKIFIYTY